MPHSLRAIVALGFLLLLAPGANGVTWHVATTGDDLGPGTPDKPFLTIARGIDAATTGDIVLIYNGTYTGAGNRDIDVVGKGLKIKSSSGDPAACIVDAERDTSGTGWVFWTSSPGDPVAIEGLTITGGTVGGVRLRLHVGSTGQKISVKDCVFDRTSTGVAMATPHYNSVTGCQFIECDVGIDNMEWTFGYPYAPPLDVNDCVFRNCGIGIKTGGYSDNVYKSIRNCRFIDNRWGILTDWHDALSVEDCEFIDNETGCLGYVDDVQFLRCEFIGNTSAAISSGLYWGWVQVRSCIIRDNPGNGISIYGTMLDLEDTEVSGSGRDGVSATVSVFPNISNCIISNNSGTGVHVSVAESDGRGRLINTTIAHNGAGLSYIRDYMVRDFEVTNTIIAFNSGEAIMDNGVTYTNCDVYGNGPDLVPDNWVPWVDGNLELDPLFCGPDHGDYHVSGLSPCTDNQGNAVIGAFGVGCDDAVAIDDIELLARWTDDGVEITWNGHSRAFSRGANLVRSDELTTRSTVLSTWSADSFPGSGRFVDLTVQPWQSYTYSIVGLADGGAARTEARLDSRTSLPSVSRLGRIYPNPSNPKATIEYVLARDEKVKLEVYDLAGRRIFQQDFGVVLAGPGAFEWNGVDAAGRNVAAGSYLVRLVTGSTSDTSRLVIVK